MIPTEEQYNKAKIIVADYENEQKRILVIKVKELEKDLKEYFKNNLLDGHYKVESFELVPCWSGNPKRFDIDIQFADCYVGGNDDDIKLLAEKHDMDVSFASWMRPK